MKRIYFFATVFIIFILATTCKKIDVPDGTPKCIKKVIREMMDENKTNPPAEVWEYKFENRKVYFIPIHGCCDVPSRLLDDECQTICFPDGGLWGGGDGKCPDFFTERTDEKLIWRDNR